MKRSHLLGLTIVFLFVIGLWYYLTQPEKSNVADLYAKVTTDFDKEAISSIEARVLNQSGHGLELIKDKDGWKVGISKQGHSFWAPAKKSKVERLLGLLQGLQGEVRAEGKRHLSVFGLDEGKGLKVTLKKGKSDELSIIIGGKGPEWGSSFVRRPGSNTVYLVQRDILSVFDIWSKRPDKPLDPDPWVNLKVIPAFPSDIDRCSYGSDVTDWVLSRLDEGEKDSTEKGKKVERWTFKKDDSLSEKSQKEVIAYLSKILPLKARDILPAEVLQKTNASKDRRLSAHFAYRLKAGPEKRVEIASCSKKNKTCLVKAGQYVYKIDGSWKKMLDNPFSKEKKVAAKGKGSASKSGGNGKR